MHRQLAWGTPRPAPEHLSEYRQDPRPEARSVLTFSDLQADIVADLIRRGLNVHAFNQRSITGILDMVRMLGAMVDANERTRQLVDTLAER